MSRSCRFQRVPWRLASPACLLLALLLVPCPWLEVETGHLFGPPLRSGDASPGSAPQGEVYPDGSGRVKVRDGVVSLSGLRLACGPYFVPRTADKDSGKVLDWSPWVAVCPFALLGGILFGFALRPGIRRVAAVGLCSALALLPPLAIREYQTFSGYVETRSTVWLLAALCSVMGSAVALGAEGWWTLRSKRPAPAPGQGAAPDGAGSPLEPSAGNACLGPPLSSRPG